MKYRLFAMAVFASMLLGGVGTQAQAAKPPGQQETLINALVLGADLHLSRQGDYSGYTDTWEWLIGTGTGPNVQGISGTGLLAAYERTLDAAYLDGAIAAGDSLVARYASQVPSYATRPYSQDVEFLVRLATDSDEPSYAVSAAEFYSRRTDNRTAIETADYYITARKSLAGWDLASQIRASLAVGETEYAAGIALRLVERRADWTDVPYGGWDATVVSHASLLWAFAELNDSSFNSYVREIRDALLLVQADDGSWDGGDYQTTAYAILGLVSDGTAKGAQNSAWAYLRDTQTAEGGWHYAGYGELGEVNSEVLMAFGVLDLKGIKAGLTDPQPEHGGDIHPLDPTP